MSISRVLFRAAAAAFVAVSMSACGGIDDLRATEATVSRSIRVYALSTAPPQYPSGINTPFASAAVVDPFANFDIALDFGAGSGILVHPVRRVVAAISGINRVGLQTVATPFETIDRAPTGGYVKDSTFTIVQGQVLVVEAERLRQGDYCSFAISPNIYSKIVVDAVNREEGSMDLRITSNPNCGFRSFEEGVPKN